jgi:hypothetical protein
VRLKRTAWLLFFCVVFTTCVSRKSYCQQGVQPVPSRQTHIPPTDEDEATSRITHDMAKKANQERQLALKNDTEKLLKMAVELKAYVDKTNENVLSLDVIKKSEEIEKLAHSIRDKMKGPN